MKTYLLLLGWLFFLAARSTIAAESTKAPGDVTNPDAAIAASRQSDDMTNQAGEILEDAASPADYQRAADLLEKAVAVNPVDLDAQLTLGWVYLDKLHQPQAAYPHLRAVVKGRPEDANGRKLLGVACLQTGRTHEAVEQLREASRLQPDDLWVRANLARALARSGHRHEAWIIYEEVLKADPNNEQARLGVAELEAWRGQSAKPLEELDAIVKANPTNVDALVLRGDIHRWNWQLAAARDDYHRALAIAPNEPDANNGLRQAWTQGAPYLTGKAYEFTDDTDFGRASVGADGRVPMTDHAYLYGGADAWRFSNPGFDDLYRIDGHAGVDIDWTRWLETSAEGDVFNQLRYLGNEKTYFGGQFFSRITPTPDRNIYLVAGYDQPFVSSMATVTNNLKQIPLGAGLDMKIAGPVSVQNSFEWARISDGNHWWEEKPQLSLQVLHWPATFIRGQFDYLTYHQVKTNYWTPDHFHTVAPVFSTSLPLGQFFRFDFDGSTPYVFETSKFGYQMEGGPTLDLGRWVELKGTGYLSHIPESQVTWSGNGWQAYLRIFF